MFISVYIITTLPEAPSMKTLPEAPIKKRTRPPPQRTRKACLHFKLSHVYKIRDITYIYIYIHILRLPSRSRSRSAAL